MYTYICACIRLCSNIKQSNMLVHVIFFSCYFLCACIRVRGPSSSTASSCIDIFNTDITFNLTNDVGIGKQYVCDIVKYARSIVSAGPICFKHGKL